jgi:hypothetical protein
LLERIRRAVRIEGFGKRECSEGKVGVFSPQVLLLLLEE